MTPQDFTTRRIEDEIARDRQSLADTIGRLQDRVSFDRLAQDAMDMIRDNAGSYTRSLDHAMRSNPLAVALIGAGVAWMVLGPRSRTAEPGRSVIDDWEGEGGAVPGEDPSKAQAAGGASQDWSARLDSLRHDAAHRVRGIERSRRAGGSDRDHDAEHAGVLRTLAGDMKDALSSGLEDLSEEARDKIVKAREAAYRAAMGTRGFAVAATRQSGRLVEDHPMLTGLAAFAFGAGVASCLPRTEAEDRLFGAERDRLMQEASDMLSAERDRVVRAAGDVADEMRKGLQQAGAAVSDEVARTGAAIRERVQSDETGSGTA